MQLVRFLMKLASEYVQIELKDGTVVAGTVLSVTPNMNTVLKDVRMTVKNEDPVSMDTITLRGSSIRYYVLPDTVNLDSMIIDDARRPSTVRPPPPKRGRGGLLQRGAGRGSPRGRGPLRGALGGPGFSRGGTRGRGLSRGRGRGRGRGREFNQ